jgi:hypothetical protein
MLGRTKFSVPGVVAGAVMFMGAPGVASSAAAFEVEAVEVNEVFIPVGFDDNDEVTVVLDGFLKSSCYKLANAEYEIDEETLTIRVTQLARKFPGPCQEALIAYSNELRIGHLPEGKFTVVANEGAVKESLPVAAATSAGPDDFFYAPLDQVSVHRTPGAMQQYVLLEGRFTNTCMKIVDVRIIDNGKSVNVLPIMNEKIEGPECKQAEIEFKVPVDLPAGMQYGRHLVHVRSLSGRSHNVLFSVGVGSAGRTILE